MALPRTLIEHFRDITDPNDIARHMRCRACGKKTVTAYAVLPDSMIQAKLPFKAVWGFGQGEKE